MTSTVCSLHSLINAAQVAQQHPFLFHALSPQRETTEKLSVWCPRVILLISTSSKQAPLVQDQLIPLSNFSLTGMRQVNSVTFVMACRTSTKWLTRHHKKQKDHPSLSCSDDVCCFWMTLQLAEPWSPPQSCGPDVGPGLPHQGAPSSWK